VEKEQEEPHFCGWVCNDETPDPRAASLLKKRVQKRRRPPRLVLHSFLGGAVKNRHPETRYIRFLGGSISQNLNLKKQLNTRAGVDFRMN
jgi:hypothetical protein